METYILLMLIILLVISLFIYYKLQERIGLNQKSTRKRFVMDNPDLMVFFNRDLTYKEYVPVQKPKETQAGMTDEEKKSL